LIRDQYLLFGPLEAAASSTRFAELDAVQAELTRVQAELVQEREQRQQAESTHQARVAEEEGRRKTAEKTAADAQAEVQSLKNEILGILSFLGSYFFSWVLFDLLHLFVRLLFS